MKAIGVYDADKGGIVYSDGCQYSNERSSDGSMQEILVNSDESGILYFQDGYLYWQDDKDPTGEDCFYEEGICAFEWYQEYVIDDSTTSEFLSSDVREYLLPESNKRYLTTEDLEGLTSRQVCYAKNEIYARHGRKFLSQELTDYFNSKLWYSGIIEAADFTEETVNALFNEYEKENVKFLANWEEKNGAYSPQ